MEEHCPQPGLPAREDFVIVAETLSQVSKSAKENPMPNAHRGRCVCVSDMAESTNPSCHYDESYGTQSTHLPMISLSWSSVQKPLNPATRNPAYGTLLLTGS